MGVILSDETLGRFAVYLRELLLWNQKFNLTRITDPEDIVIKHFLDSLSCVRAASFEGPLAVVDIGTGAGFPGVPLKLAFPHIRLTLLDSLQKRIEFLEALCAALKLEGVTLIHARAEEAGRNPDLRESFDIALCRAVAFLPVLVEYGLPLLCTGGKLIAMKGPEGESEMPAARKALQLLGGSIQGIHRFCLPGTDMERQLIVIEKLSPTPPAYPRRPGTPERKPL